MKFCCTLHLVVTLAFAGHAHASPGRIVQLGTPSDDTQIAFGTTDPDLIVQFGFSGKDLQYTEGEDGDDVIVQNGGSGNDDLTTKGGIESDRITVIGGDGDDRLKVNASYGDDIVRFEAESGADTITFLTILGTPMRANMYVKSSKGCLNISLSSSFFPQAALAKSSSKVVWVYIRRLRQLLRLSSQIPYRRLQAHSQPCPESHLSPF